MPTHPGHFRNDIEGLRGLAVLAVVAFHFDEAWLPGGFAGVDVFFAISGYVVTGALLRLRAEPWGRLLGIFYARRVKRILPALLLCVLCTDICVALFVPPEEARTMHAAGVVASVGVSNIHFAFQGQDYFGLALSLNPFTHTWSLGVEEQFYLVFPCLLLALGVRRRLGTGLQVSLLLVAALSAVAFVVLGVLEPHWAFYSMPARFWELALGASLALADRAGSGGSRRWPAALSLPMLALAFLWPRLVPDHGIFAACAGVVGALAVMGASVDALPNRWLAAAPFTHLGRISYALYLWHWPVLTMQRWMFGMDSAQHVLAAAGLMYALALGTTRWVEAPVRASRPGTRALVWGALAAVLGTAGVSGALLAPLEGALFLDKPALAVRPQRWWPRTCHIDPLDGGRLETCVPSGPLERERIFLVGDSHAGNFWPVLEQLTPELEYALSGLTVGGGCTFAPPLLHDTGYMKREACQRYNERLRARVVQSARPGDLVVTGIDRRRIAGPLLDFMAASPASLEAWAQRSGERAEAYVAYLARFARALQARGASLVVLGDVPTMRRDPRQCPPVWWQTEASLMACGTPTERSSAHAAPLREALRALAGRLDSVHFWDPHDLLCTPRGCLPRRDGKPLFVDEGHISIHAATLLADPFGRWLRGLRPATGARE